MRFEDALRLHSRRCSHLPERREVLVAEREEPLLRGDPVDMWVTSRPEHPDLWVLYKQHVASFWTPEEIDLEADARDWDRLSDNERHFVSHVLAFFAASDGIVTENLAANFCKEVTLPEARAFYSFQIAMETIHSETYGILIERLVWDSSEARKLLRGIETLPAVQKKAAWAAQWLDTTGCFAERLAAFAAVEGILFSGSFCAIFWLKKRGLLPGLCFSNELIARDEGLHAEFACLLYSKLQRKLSVEGVHRIVKGAVEVELAFINDALPCSLIGMNCTLMENYVKFVADRLCALLGSPKIYEAKNPFDWMEMISMQGKTNFFEKRVGEYQKAGVAVSGAAGKKKFCLDEDF